MREVQLLKGDGWLDGKNQGEGKNDELRGGSSWVHQTSGPREKGDRLFSTCQNSNQVPGGSNSGTEAEGGPQGSIQSHTGSSMDATRWSVST